MALSQLQRGRERELEEKYQRDIDELKAQLRDANRRTQQAESEVDQLRQELASKFREPESTAGDDLANMIKALRAENEGLRNELDEARSHIFSLQPYRKDLTPREVGQVR